ncbi:hypothetical protein BURMUCGD1_4614 [Burkholderia multivorans CGD1]|nr:hypothetical protein BURMUCGD1_4614 [Burkholderia multivorans CGD1]
MPFESSFRIVAIRASGRTLNVTRGRKARSLGIEQIVRVFPV